MSTKKELTIAEKLHALYELQQIDSELDKITILKGELPQEVHDLEDEIEGLGTRIGRLKTGIDEAEEEVSNFKNGIKKYESNIERYTRQMDDVKNSREFESLQKEIELAKLDIQLHLKKMRDAEMNVDARRNTLKSNEMTLAARSKDLEVKREELAKIIEKTEKDEERLTKKSEKARKNIEDRLLRAYNKIRSSYRNGLAVAPITRNACGGCFNQIPPQLQLEIGLHKKVVACEHCGRILIDESIREGTFEDVAITQEEFL
jgi:predicted  nucleic acid-binding Zn-ribbon protein